MLPNTNKHAAALLFLEVILLGSLLPLLTSASCSAGFFRDSTLNTCEPCPEGTYQPNPDRAYCYECQVGTYQPSAQSTACIRCPVNQSTLSPNRNTGLISGATLCSYCPPGLALESNGCVDCPAGFYCNGQSGPLPCSAPRQQPVPEEYVKPTEACTATRDAVVRTCTPCGQSTSTYARQPCTLTSDAVCAPCTVCAAMQQYQVSACNATADAVCKACDYQAGDTRVGGKCNPCPPGSYGPECTPCPEGTFSAVPNAIACEPCSQQMLQQEPTSSGPGASRCVAATCCAPDGVHCESNPTAAALLLVAYDASSSSIQAAAPTLTPGRFMVVVTPAQLYVLGNGSSWLFAGAFSPQFPAAAAAADADGQGMQAVFDPSVLQLCLDPITQGYLLLERTAGTLRWISAQADVRTVELEEEVCLIASAGSPYAFWVVLSTSGRVMRLNVLDNTLSDGGYYRITSRQPLRLIVVPNEEEALYVLDAGLLIRFSRGVAQILCGGGKQVLSPSSSSSSSSCSVIGLAESGVIDMLEYNGDIYLLFFSHEQLWIGLSKLLLVGSSWELSSFLLFLPNEDGLLAPLHLIAGPDAMYLAFRSPAQIFRIGLDGHCPCQPGLYSAKNHTVCLQPPVGSIAPSAWTSTPVPCPLGSISVSAVECAPCPHGYTTAHSGSWNCRPICEPDHFMDPVTGDCMPECNASLGLYHDQRLGQCLPCWLGSGAAGETCIACPPGEYGAAPGVCAACPPGTATVVAGTSRCMPLAFAPCQDGGWTCPQELNRPSVLDPHAAGSSNSGLLVWPNGTYVLGAADRLLLTFFTVPTPTVVWTRPSNTNGTLYLGEVAVTLQLAQSLTLYHAAVLQVPGRVPVIYVSTMLSMEEGTPACAEVYSISTFDRSVTRFMSQDMLKTPTVLLLQCILQPIVLHVTRGGVLYAAVGARLYWANLQGADAAPQNLFKQLMMQVDQGVITHVSSVEEHLFVSTSTGQIHSVPHSATEAQGYQSLFVDVGAQAGAVTAMGAAGRRVLFLSRSAGLMEMVFNNVQGCMAGYMATQLETVWAGVCMQAGRGTYSGAACPVGTYGPAPASLYCVPCPAGSVAPLEGSPVCVECEDETAFSSADGTQCLAQCPPSQVADAHGGGRRCVACGPGYTKTAGACAPCPAGTYAPSGSTACLACAAGHTSLPGAHSCVRICATDAQCAYDGENCISLTNNYKVLSQVVLSKAGGTQVVALAVDVDGGVFYSDGVRIQYYLDTCTSYDTNCSQMGVNLLPAGQYTDYRFVSLAVCNRIQYASPSSPDALLCPSGAYRRLYVGSLIRSSIYSLKLCLNQNNYNNDMRSVNTTATSAGAAAGFFFTLVSGLSWPGFADGAFAKAAFNQPVDLELNAACDLLYVSDFGNHRVRLLNFSSQQVSTLVGSGQACWKEGDGGLPCDAPAAMGCDASTAQCPSVQYPLGIGLSEDESLLYLSGNLVNSLFAFRLATKELTNICRFAYTNMAYGSVQTCNLNALGSKGCMLHRPFDVAAFQGQLFVGVTQGITRVDERTRVCEQVAGQFFDLQTTGLYDGIMPLVDTTSASTTSLVNMPFKMAVSEGTGVLYFADLLNGAVRRVLVKTVCQCPAGTLRVPSAHACYNPSPFAGQLKPLLECPSGLYALPGDWACFRSCAEALAPVAQCMVLPTSPLQSVTYAQLLSRLSPPQNTLPADWYGEAGPFDSGGLFPLTTTFRQGAAPGRAPSSHGHFASLTFDVARQCWSDVEASYALRPQLILPGLWFACGAPFLASNPHVCTCPTTVVGFERTPTTPEEEAAAALRPKRWQALRNAAVAGGSPGLDQSSVFIMLGTADQSAPHTCPSRGEGPCFPVFRLQSALPVENTFMETWDQDHVLRVQCRMGWPAHYACPDGYVWTPPTLITTASCSGASVMATCLSCLPGTYSSSASPHEKQVQGGPYKCKQCEAGFYASGVGSTECLACPANTYSSAAGGTRCTACSLGKRTPFPAAYSVEQCEDCPWGTGNCTACVPGEFQPLQGQLRCQITPAGYFTPAPSANAPTPCPAGTYQRLQGRTTCRACDVGFISTQGATACTACPTSQAVAACPLTIGNRCASGCGLNKYYDYPSGQCLTCPQGKLNAQDPCASDPNVCWESPRRDFYLDPVSQTIAQCPPGAEASRDKAGCVLCDAGSYSDLATGGCAPCRAGTYSTLAGSTGCLLCAPGFSNLPGLQSCDTACLPGTYAPVNGSSACLSCAAGFIAARFQSTTCQACAIDTVAPAAGMSQCNETCNTSLGFYSMLGDTACRYCANGLAIEDTCRTCGLGHYLSTAAERVCLQCPAGRVNLLDPAATDASQACTPCPSPTAYALLNGMQCVESEEGFVPNSSMTGPMACAAGTFRNRTQTQCTPCAPGLASSSPGARQCAPCAMGFYAESAGLQNCIQCPSGSVSSYVGATACTACAAGSYASGAQACLPCSNNTYSLGRTATVCLPCSPPLYAPGGASVCSACPDWTTWSPEQRGCATCTPGKYMVPSSLFGYYECVPCPQGTFLPFRGSRSYQNCTACPPGTIAPVSGAAVCTNCTQAGTTAQPDGISCTRCGKGTYNVDGGVCVPCARGTFMASRGASACQICAPGTFQNVTMGGTTCFLCPPGTISDGSTGKECLSCAGWPGKFAPGPGQTICVPRKTVCKPLEYYNVSYDPAQDNTCVPCTPCAPDQLVLVYDSNADKLRLLLPDTSATYQYQLCPGTTDAPLYRCLSTAPVAGQYVSISQSVGAAVGNSMYDPYTLNMCEDPEFDNATVAWVAGFDIQACYVSCLYGINPQAVAKVYQDMPPPVYAEDPQHNVFLQRMLPWKGAICLPCPKSACPLGLYRPDYTGRGCGPPCGLPGSDNVCRQLDSTGCIAPCTNKPAAFADYVGGGTVLGRNWCPWQCLLGWYLSDNRTACLPCATAGERRICNSSDYAVVPVDQCLPWHTSKDLCKYCPPMPFARLVGWNSTTGGACQYACISGYYANTSSSSSSSSSSNFTIQCTPCRHVWLYNWTVCPVGMYLDEAQCHRLGVRPECKPCVTPTQNSRASFVSVGELDAPASCKASCAPGFHTVAKSTGAYADYTDLSTFPPIGDLQCVMCLPDDMRSCNFTHACFAGYFRNMSVRDGQNNSCVACRQSRQCPTGTYAPVCTGDTLVDAQCLPCASSLLVHQRFVPYGLTQGRIIQPDYCPRVCLNNHVQKQLSPTECEPCPTTTPCLLAGVQPPLCAFVYAYWNATPAVAWWDAQHAPPHIPYSSTTKLVPRAGVCWACPIGTATLPESTALCVPLPGFSSVNVPLPNAKLPIPSLPSDIYFTMQAPRVPTLIQRNSNSRRLYQVEGSSPSTTTTTTTALAIAAVPCPYGTYKASAGDAVCNVCPQGSSTMSTGSTSLSACMCKYGHYLATRLRGPCLPCPEDTFSNVSVSVQSSPAKCLACPPNTSTLGVLGATACACALGYVRTMNGQCVLCSAGFYCPPCTEADAQCIPSDQRPCFVGSTSPPGSHGVSNCTCGPGLVRATRPKGDAQFYCRTLPLGSATVTADGQLTCLPGWTRSGNGDACTLCPPGTYAALASDGVSLLLRVTDGTPICQPCPANTYNPTVSAIGGCTPCPSQQITAQNGSVRLSECACPPSTLPVPGGCKGCLANQYTETVSGLCMACPPNSLAQAGASSIKDCLCVPGYELVFTGLTCEQCQTGFYSTHASNAPCARCPKGSTTAGPGSTRLSACGETAGLCLPGYTWRLGVGCFLA